MAHSKGGDIKVVIADDHLSFGQALQLALDKEPDLLVVEVVGDGEEAVSVTVEQEPDVVVMDLQMPRLDGVEATRRITRSSPDTAVIVLSGFDDQLSIGRAIQAGARGLLSKTQAIENLADAIRRAHGGQSLHDAAAEAAALDAVGRRKRRDGDLAQRIERLTPRELEILQALADGGSPTEVAEELGLSPNTLRTHTQNVLTKLGVHSKLEAIVAAIAHGKVVTPLPGEPPSHGDRAEADR